MHWESNQREQLKNVMRKRQMFTEVGVHIFLTQNYRDLPSPTDLKSKLQSWLPAHSCLCLALPHSMQHSRPPSTPQHCAPESAGLTHSLCSRGTLQQSSFLNFRLPLQSLPISLPKLLYSCHPPILPPLFNSLREVKIGRSK